MANSFVEIQNGTALVHVDGSAVIDTVVQLHKTFLEAIESRLSVILNIEKVTDCDSSFIQLISSFCYTLKNGGRTLVFSSDSLPEPINQVINVIGFNFRCNCTRIDNEECILCKVNKNSEQKLENRL